MNDLTKVLNQRIADKISRNQPGPDQLGQKMNFDELLQSKKTALDDTLASLTTDKSPQNVQSVADIQVNLGDTETSLSNPNASSPWNKGLDLFSRMNENFNSLEMAVEVISDPNFKADPTKLVAFQLGTNQLNLELEMDSKLVSNGVKALTRIFDMQI